jgi:tRNA(Arg) A34 adenosine deaminase TadA
MPTSHPPGSPTSLSSPAAPPSASESARTASNVPPGTRPNDGLAIYWNKPVSELVEVKLEPFAPEQSERHTIYSLLTMALIHHYWNGNKSGAVGTYPWRPKQMIGQSRYRGDQFGDRYVGHNIACVAVDENGELIDFEFNHNELYNSSAEHAEGRLIRRVFSLNQIYDHWQAHAAGESRHVGYGNVFNGVTIYTSLESCAQCSGIMALASCLRVVFLQSDPGQYLVGNLLYNLTRPHEMPGPSAELLAGYSRPSPAKKYWAPEPVDALEFRFKYKRALDEAYLRFAKDVMDESKDLYFFKGLGANDRPQRSPSITSFLCTDVALEIFEAASQELEAFEPAYPDHRPVRSDGRVDGVFTNSEALSHVRAFLHHAVKEARRATPHR